MISLDTPDDQPTVSLGPETTAPVNPSAQTAIDRANKAAYGVGQFVGKTVDEMFQAMSQGREEAIRQEAATSWDYQKQLKKTENLRALSQRGNLNYDQVKSVLSDTPTDPSTVIEKGFSTNYVNSVDDASGNLKSGNIGDSASKEIPNQVADIKAKGTELLTKYQIINSIDQDLNDTIAQQGWVPWLADQAKGLVQLYPEIKMRGLNKDTSIFTGITLGQNLQAQADDLWKLPSSEFNTRLKGIVDKLKADNPTLAKQFVSYVKGKGQSDQALDDVFTALVIPDVATAGELGAALVRKAALYNKTNKAIKDMVKTSAEAEAAGIPPKAAAAEGAGDNVTAGVVRAAANADAIIKGTPDVYKTSVDVLTSNFRLDAQKLGEAPGSLSREQLTRLQDRIIEDGDSLISIVQNVARVNRTPVPVELEKALTAYKDDLVQKFPGINNAILDTSFKHEPISNTYHTEVHIGNLDGSLFSSPEVAKNFAELHGFENVGVRESTGTVTKEPAKLIGPVKSLERKRQLEGPTGSIEQTVSSIKKWTKILKDPTLTKEAREEAKQQVGFFKDSLIKYKKELETHESKLSVQPAVIEQNGLGYKLIVTRPYNEASDVVRNYQLGSKEALSTVSDNSWHGIVNGFIGKLRGADDTLAINDSINRKIATYARGEFEKWAKEASKEIDVIAKKNFGSSKVQTLDGTSRLSNKEIKNQFKEVIDFARTAKDGEGYFFKTPAELESHYMTFYNRLPTFEETSAYFTVVKVTEADRVFREIMEFRNRARLGAEQHQVSFLKDGKITKSGFFDGVQRREFPGGHHSILVMGNKAGEEKLYTLGHIPSKTLEDLRQGTSTGKYRVIEIWDPDSHPLRSLSDIAGNERIRYVLSQNYESKPLEFNHINRRGGGHFDYAYDHYIKQARMSPLMRRASGEDRRVEKMLYTGDTTLMPIENRALGKDIVNKLNKARSLLAEGNKAEAEAFVRSNLPIEWDEFNSWFKHSRDKEGKIIPPKLDLNEPFRVVPKNKRIADMDNELVLRHGNMFEDATRSGSLAQQHQIAYTMERDSNGLKTVVREGTPANPVYKYVPAKLVDPIPTMNRALNRIINTTFMDDYKMYAMEHWLREAEPHLNFDVSEIRSAPFWVFEKAFENFKGDVDPLIKANLLANREKIKQFIGIPSTFDQKVTALTQHLVDKAYDAGVIGKKLSVVPIWALGKIHDPIRAVRTLAFHAKLGLFAVPQIIVQAQTFTNILALAPKNVFQGTSATLLHQYSRFNRSEAMLSHLDDLASKMGWKPGEWLEAHKELKNVGFEHVAGEYALKDEMDVNFFKSNTKGFLKAGEFFFTEGERSTRLGAWYTAFHEFRAANPSGALTASDRAKILQRADLLTNNMSRASNSTLHTGIMSLPTQFLTYQLRLAELFMGRRLGETIAERTKARAGLVLAYSTMYGVTNSAGLLGWPLGDDIRDEAIKRGYTVGDNYLSSLLMEGLPATLLSMITGKHYNIGDRYGAQGFTSVRQALSSDSTWWDLIGGAGVSMLGSLYTAGQPLLASITSAIRGTFSSDIEKHPFKISDAIDILKEISSVNQAWKAYSAIQTGRWLTKNEGWVTDVKPLEAVMLAMTGLSPQEQNDMYRISNIMKSEKEYQDYQKKMIIKEIRRGLADGTANPETLNDNISRAYWRMEFSGMPIDKRSTIIAEAMQGHESQLDIVMKNWATKHVPTKRTMFGVDIQKDIPDTRMEQYKSYLRNKE